MSERESPAMPLQDAVPTERLLASLEGASGAGAFADAIAAATGSRAAVGDPVTNGGYTAVPLLETVFAGGYGMGVGAGNGPQAGEKGPPGGAGGGAGGGGGSHTRVVAVLVVGPDGVEIRPVVDATKLGIAAIGLGLGLIAVLRRVLKR